MKKLDLGWGDPFFLLDILSKKNIPTTNDLKNMIYPPDPGMESLLDHVRKLTEKTTGNKYKYYLITNGATHALNTVMRVFEKDRGVIDVITSRFGYPYYPHMIDKTMSLTRRPRDLINLLSFRKDQMVIIDSPSNPAGLQHDLSGVLSSKNIVWDAVYHNRIYNADPSIKPIHEVYVGSLSKLLGITGARIGWIAVNDLNLYTKLLDEGLYEIATVSKPSQQLAINILDNIDVDNFMNEGKRSLDNNREIMQKLAGLLGQDVQESGMFYFARTDNRILDLFDKSNIKCVNIVATGNSYIRLNLGQTREVIEQSVKRILKADTIRK